MKSSQVTIKDIARELGISPSTVSRALKDHPDISPDTKKVVKALAEKLNYQPNIVALNLRQSKTNTIGVIVPELVHFFFSTVISGIEDVAYKNGYNIILSQSNESYEREVSDLRALFNSRVDGLLISVSRETSNFDHFKSVFERGMPMVFFDRAVDELDTSKIIVDDSDGAYQATKHLIEQGCKRIAHIAGPDSLLISKKRTDGYIKALGDHNIMVDNNMIIPCNEGSIESAKEIAMKLFHMKNRPDGIFTSHDLTALGAMQAAKELKIKIPDELAVIGFSNWQVASFTEPTLSSVDQPGYEMGKQAAELLLKEIVSKEDQFIEPQTKILPTKLIIRESSKRK
ncbi:MAG: LacI family DNA-binding transcriptional regulator [Candidatus Cyclobacteriaceae bacterium M2_1C_046]